MDDFYRPCATLPPDAIELPDQRIDLWLVPHPPRARSGPALRAMLRRYLGCAAEAVELLTGPHGRPRLADPAARLGFSASHAGDWLLLAFGRDIEPGVDIERLAPRHSSLPLARRYFPAAEADWLAGLAEGEREPAFYRAWTAREAVLKATGRGLAFGLDRIELAPGSGPLRLSRIDGDDPAAWQLQSLPAPAGYCAALAWRGAPMTLQGFRLPAEPG